jgi:hypothetical protein
LNSYTPEAIRRLLVGCSFDIVAVKGSGKFKRLGNIRPSLFSPDLILLCRKKE